MNDKVQAFFDKFNVDNIGYLIFGVVLLAFPSYFTSVICYIIGFLFILFGATSLIASIKAGVSNSFGIIFSIFSIFIGVIFMINPEPIISFIPLIIGFSILSGGISSVHKANLMKQEQYEGYQTIFIFAVLKILFAITLIINPFNSFLTLVRFMGVATIFNGCSGSFIDKTYSNYTVNDDGSIDVDFKDI